MARKKSASVDIDKAVNPITVSDENRRDETDAIPGRAAVLHCSKQDSSEQDKGDLLGEIYSVTTVDSEGYPDDVTFRVRNGGDQMLNAKYSEIDALPNGFPGI